MGDCFVIMPISTPEVLVPTYSGDKDHFKHVYDHLLAPAIEKAGFKAIPPAAKGSDLIHAEIIKKIEQSELVLCDMSSLNANVFFELGIRTAVNKPVCIVKDDQTVRVPFDTGILNHAEYFSSLAPWTLQKQIDDLSEHIRNSASSSAGQNTLWRYFGLSTRAELSHGKASQDDKLSLLSLQVEALTRKLGESESDRILRKLAIRQQCGEVIAFARSLLGSRATSVSMQGDNGVLICIRQCKLTSDEFMQIQNFANNKKVDMEYRMVDSDLRLDTASKEQP
jgi:hypothetical protein